MGKEQFKLEEATIDSIHEAIDSGEITSEALVNMYIKRIEEYDEQLNSIVLVNPNAVDEAKKIDEYYKTNNRMIGPLHGIPILIKDQFYTKDMNTTFGSVAFKDFRANTDATVITKLQEAGAIILAKTAMPDFATSWFGFSSVSGETKNPYNTKYDPGASSSGTGAAIAANLGAVGIGSDCGGSIRVPASFCNLVGMRVTTGMISRDGMSPLVNFQDTPGPMTRSVKDSAILLEVLAGHDPKDKFTGVNAYRASNYTKNLTVDSLKGARIGILKEVFATGEDAESINGLINNSIQQMENAGATIIDPITIPNLKEYLLKTSLYTVQSKKDFNEFIAGKENVSVKDINEIYDRKLYHEELDLLEAIVEEASVSPEKDPKYFEKRLAQEEFRREILHVFSEHNLDAIVFPDVQVLPPVQDEIPNLDYTVLTFPTNTLIASQSILPAISVPAGFTNEGIPVGLELLGKPYDEDKLLNLAYSYEKNTNFRKPSPLFPELEA